MSVHTCHHGCPCQAGGEPAPDFTPAEGVPLHWLQALRGKSGLFTAEEARRLLGSAVPEASHPATSTEEGDHAR